MIESEDWDRLYYAIVRIRSNKTIQLLGIGSTKLICRNSALDSEIARRSANFRGVIDAIESTDIGVNRTMFGGCEYTMVYCEAKVYIYGKRYGYDNMLLVYDPTYREDLIRFAGYKKRIKKRE